MKTFNSKELRAVALFSQRENLVPLRDLAAAKVAALRGAVGPQDAENREAVEFAAAVRGFLGGQAGEFPAVEPWVAGVGEFLDASGAFNLGAIAEVISELPLLPPTPVVATASEAKIARIAAVCRETWLDVLRLDATLAVRFAE